AAPYPKFALDGGPPLQASSQSLWWPLERGRLGVGRWYSMSLDSGNKTARPPQPGHASAPLSPMKRMPLLSNESVAAMASGRGGLRPPSYQVNLTAGLFPRGPN